METIIKTAVSENIKESSFKNYKQTSVKLYNIINTKKPHHILMDEEEIMKGFGLVINKFQDLKFYLEDDKNNFKNTTKKNYINNLLNVILKITDIDNFCIKNKKKLEIIKADIRTYWLELRGVVEEKQIEKKHSKALLEKELDYDTFVPLVGYEIKYEINKRGEVKSKDSGKILKPNIINKQNKARIALTIEGKKKLNFIHNLVAKQFIPNDNEELDLVEHINKDPLDNCVDNLVWIKSYVVEIHKAFSKAKKLIGRSSKYCNVYLNKDENKWECSIRINGVKQLIGSYEDEYQAAIAHKNKLEMIMGLFESTLPQEPPTVIV